MQVELCISMCRESYEVPLDRGVYGGCVVNTKYFVIGMTSTKNTVNPTISAKQVAYLRVSRQKLTFDLV